jgi:hypothetical protein
LNYPWLSRKREIARRRNIINRPLTYNYIQVRLFKGLIAHLVFGRSNTPAAMLNESGYPRLFSYLITSCSTPVIDCDYNLHKSNSSFFSDADINRTQLMCSLFKHVLSQSSLIDQPKRRKNPLLMALGGTSCIFKREIKPLQKFEIWSRVLSWDDKWVYVVSYFVSVNKSMGKQIPSAKKEKPDDSPPNSRVLASCIARYVFKDRRVTVRPESILQECGLLPHSDLKEAKEDHSGTQWSGAKFDKERLKGLQIASRFTELEALPTMFDSSDETVLGSYIDL